MNADALTRLIRAAAIEAAEHQERFAAEDVEARKIVEIMESFLRVKGRVVYGGAAINAHMPAEQKFYDPTVNLPDYDFLTPDPLQDCADLIVSFQEEGFTEVEAKFGIHEGTYKVFVNFRSAADITFMPEDLYGRLAADSVLIDGIRYASPDYLRMNMYLELSRPAGDVSRWEKVYKRLLLLNDVHPPMVSGSCPTNPLAELGQGTRSQGTGSQGTRGTRKQRTPKSTTTRYNKIINIAIENHAVFLSGASYLAPTPTDPDPSAPVLLMSASPGALKTKLTSGTLRLHATAYPAIGELLPPRTEYFLTSALETSIPVAVVFETVACHAYTTLADPEGYRLASLDTLIQMYYALAFTDLAHYIPGQIQCVIQALIDIESQERLAAAEADSAEARHAVFPLECLGHQPTLPELKRAHRDRVRAKKAELTAAAAATLATPGTTTPAKTESAAASASGSRRRRRTTQRRKKAATE